jgi:uncharacterized membrane protein YgdD (TMEM256/DUF423 family)
MEGRRNRLATGIWAGANVLLLVFGVLWVALAFGLRSECDELSECDDWATADAYALAAAVVALMLAAILSRQRRWWLSLSSLLLCVPVYHALFV